MTRKHVYLLLAIIGFIVPYYFLISFLRAHGLDGRLFLAQLYGAPASAFFAVDLVISCLVFLVFWQRESNRLGIRHRWIYFIALATVGLSFALPLFLWARETYVESRDV
jgi:hypothetical protein